MDFEEATSSVLSDLKLNYRLKDNQALAVQAICRGDDVFALLPTGYGKSDVFVLPPLILNKVFIIDIYNSKFV